MKKLLKNTLIGLGVSFLAVALITRWPAVQPLLMGAHWGLLALAYLGLLVSPLLHAGVWSQMLSSFGKRVSFNQATQVWIRCEALRWLPGKPFGDRSRVAHAKDLGLTKSQASESLVMELSLSHLVWVVAASLLLLTPITHLAWEKVVYWLPEKRSPLLLIGLLPPSLGLIAVMALRISSLGKVMRRIVRLVSWPDLKPAQTLRACLACLALSFFHGILLWTLIRAVPGLDINLATSIGIAGGAWLAAFWLFCSPNSLGVRDAALIALLSLYGPLDSAIAVALLWRAMLGVTELTSLLLARHAPLSMGPKVMSPPPRPFRSFRFLNII